MVKVRFLDLLTVICLALSVVFITAVLLCKTCFEPTVSPSVETAAQRVLQDWNQ